jgi:hypothetical protein
MDFRDVHDDVVALLSVTLVFNSPTLRPCWSTNDILCSEAILSNQSVLYDCLGMPSFQIADCVL